MLPLMPYTTCELLITRICDAYGSSNSATVWLQAQEKQLSQLGDQNVTLKEEMADLKSRLVFVCVFVVWLSPFFILAKHTVLSLLVHGCYWYQAAESNAFDSFRR